MSEGSVLSHVTYRPKTGREQALLGLIEKHWPTLNALGLTSAEPAKIYRAEDKPSGDVYFIEIFAWKNEEASEIAHQTPEVMAVWEPMDGLLDRMELARIDRVDAAA